jgi:hypothetical protein
MGPQLLCLTYNVLQNNKEKTQKRGVLKNASASEILWKGWISVFGVRK